MSVYADSSFFASLYLRDLHFQETQRLLASRPRVFFTSFHRAELANAIYRQAFLGRMREPQAQLAFADCEDDCVAGIWNLVDFPEQAFERSVELARRRVALLGVRTLDTLHVAAALELRASRFWTFDERQGRLAEAEGLTLA